MRSPSLPPLSADGDSVQEVYRKQSTRIEELEKDNKRLEKEREEASGRWRKTEEQLEDLRESSVDAAELKDKLEKTEQKAAEIDSLVSIPEFTALREMLIRSLPERGDCISPATELASSDEIAS